jgi:hypothetical protein
MLQLPSRMNLKDCTAIRSSFDLKAQPGTVVHDGCRAHHKLVDSDRLPGEGIPSPPSDSWAVMGGLARCSAQPAGLPHQRRKCLARLPHCDQRPEQSPGSPARPHRQVRLARTPRDPPGARQGTARVRVRGLLPPQGTESESRTGSEVRVSVSSDIANHSPFAESKPRAPRACRQLLCLQPFSMLK